ncbi:hypothetical protein SAMD00019534_075080 [Acytostelium subglobosum LB1]|uniref:hypothetical protein n=1 Tax=Acytostelium subglobosum LB1 TaxID=1410327 RepID=UPI000644C952|nr:hypothetical protein SAMD00019534_075080 [Acytostelium subglobosum LB1]GAM24333.1 hypothetical protein SAMD00019534_075080 [Acytostelium subglobosum LB1]|eukprot:XP_012752659.1 hypothetical protein SAMD00019534_075080 [Acytostelium subglobosum LB1]
MTSSSSSLNKDMSYLSNLIQLSDQVRYALNNNIPVVALESTIISHGMPYPQNYQTAKQVEDIVRENGAVPATIAIINGTIRVGLDDALLHHLATVGKHAVKTSRRDLAVVVSQDHLVGSTTVSATILISNLAGIKVFVTGGLGGVHRGAEVTMDISADLTELGKNDVAVVCAGVKSILDIGKTLEYLETQGVTVITYQSDKFPSFFTSTSAFQSPNRLDTPKAIAKVIHTNHQLTLGSGMVIAVPNDYPNKIDIDTAIEQAIKEAEMNKISGKDTTPYLLKRVNELTGGQSLESNIHLIKRNAVIGSQIAAQLAILRGPSTAIGINNQQPTSIADVVVVGGAVIDLMSHPHKNTAFTMGTSNPGSMSIKVGGVGRNIAEVTHRLNMNTLFVSLVGKDIQSHKIIDHFNQLGLSTRAMEKLDDVSTATYNAIMNNGELQVAIAIMDIFDQITPTYITKYRQDIAKSKMIVFDGNIPMDTMSLLMSIGKENNIPVFFEPTSVHKSTKLFAITSTSGPVAVNYTSPNVDELLAMAKEICKNGKHQQLANCQGADFKSRDIQSLKKHTAVLLDAGVGTVFLKAGRDGVYVITNKPDKTQSFQHYAAPEVTDSELVDVTGAGDSMVGCLVYGILNNKSEQEMMKIGTRCARSSLMSSDPVSSLISPKICE